MPDKNRVLVEHVRMVKKNVRPNPQRNIKGGIAEQEAPIHVSNVMLVCPSGSRRAWATSLKATRRCASARSAADDRRQSKKK